MERRPLDFDMVDEAILIGLRGRVVKEVFWREKPVADLPEVLHIDSMAQSAALLPLFAASFSWCGWSKRR